MYCPNPECPDWKLLGIVGEYREGITHCPKCGMRLCDRKDLSHLPDPQPDVPDMLVVGAFFYRHEADLAAAHLAGSGIPAVVESDDCGAVDPALGFCRQVCLLVPAKLLEQARALLQSPDPDEAR